jgi:hypothetical protein
VSVFNGCSCGCVRTASISFILIEVGAVFGFSGVFGYCLLDVL